MRCTLRCDGKLLSPERRRRAVVVLHDRNWASERLTRRVVGPHRSTQRHPGKVVDLEVSKLWHRLREIAAGRHALGLSDGLPVAQTGGMDASGQWAGVHCADATGLVCG